MKYSLGFGILLSVVGGHQGAIAQVIPDNTIPSVVDSLDGRNFTIDGGGRSGSNLFHSFSQFSVPTSGSAIFNNAIDVQNIFSRVTGGGLSNIDGLIETKGTANLFFLNPSGLMFGPNARLNIGGSFIGTTAHSIQFADEVEFSATNVPSKPLLTVSAPIGLQMGQNPGTIQVNGSGHHVNRIGLVFLDRGNTSPGLQVTPGNTFTLVGSDIFLDGGILTANSGKVELVALRTGQWTIGQGHTLGSLASPLTSQLGEIQLRSASLLDVSGLSAGALQMMGNTIRLQDGSVVMGQNFGEQAGREFQIIGRESITLSGSTPAVSSRIVTQTAGSGNGGNIHLSAPQISLSDGGLIAAHTFSSAASGNLNIHAPQNLTLSGASPFDISNLSAVSTATFGTGAAGTVTVSTDTLTLRGGASVSSATLSQGQGGLVTVNATSLVDIEGINPFAGSTISSVSFGAGNAGDIVVNVPKVRVANFGGISSSGLASGNAGSILVHASELIDIINDQLPDLTLPPELTPLTHITSSIYIYPEYLRQILGLPERVTGNAGSVTLHTPNLNLTNAAKVTVTNRGEGDGGRLDINADRITLNNYGAISAMTASGKGGNISIRSQELLQLRQKSEISTEAGGGSGNGGNIFIESPILLGIENSDIIANSNGGSGGTITITTQGIIGLEFRNTQTPRIDLTNDITASSSIGLNGTVQINNVGVDQSTTLADRPLTFVSPDQLVAGSCIARRNANQGRFVVTGNGALPPSPYDPYHAIAYESSPDRPIEASTSNLSATPWQEATALIQTPDGRSFLVANPSGPDASVICQDPEQLDRNGP